MKKYLTIDDINALKEGGYFKFVKVGNEYRFINPVFGGGHMSIVDESEYDEVDGAGGILLFENYWTVAENYSMSL